MSEAERQLAAVRRELDDARARLDRLAARVGAEAWGRRPDPSRWSVGECVVHLNLTSEAYLPGIRSLITTGRTRIARPPRSYRRDPIGWMLCRAVAPGSRFRAKAPDAFVPGIATSREDDVTDFHRLQEKLIECVDAADGLPLGRLKLRSPFDARLKYNLYAAFRLIPLHQHRHLGQAERAVETPRRTP